MSDFQISFTEPLYLLALIPALALTFYTYFRLSKKFRRTRNRVISITLHILITVMITCLLAGLTFKYNIRNEGNNVLFVVDVSETSEKSAKERDDFLEMIINDCANDGYGVGVVTFGYTQVYAAPISNDASKAYSDYLNAPKPDTSATDIASALTYAKNLIVDGFEPATTKIVLVTDGKETDGNALGIIRNIVSTGIKINTVYFDEEKNIVDGQIIENSELQVVDIRLPERHVDVNEDFELKVAVKSKQPMDATIKFIDNGELVATIENVNFATGEQEVKVPHKYLTQGLHELECQLEITKEDGDKVVQNNSFVAYHLVESYNKILILESIQGQSERLKELLITDDVFDVSVCAIDDVDNLPKNINELLQFDQVIMNNIAYSDLPLASETNKLSDNFIDLLYSYVYDYGGNMLTVGGLTDDGKREHAYNKTDMMATKYQDMLPVQVVDYTPPVATYILIDVSGSMTSILDDAINGAHTIVDNALDEKDFIGIEALGTKYAMVLGLTSATQKNTIHDAINSVKDAKPGGGTNYAPSIDRAGNALASRTDIDKKHMIIVTDGMPADREEYPERIKFYNQAHDITFTIVVVGSNDASAKEVAKAIEGYGRCIRVSSENLITQMREDIGSIKVPSLEAIAEGFNPQVYNANSPVLNDIVTENNGPTKTQLSAKLYGYFGVKPRNDEDTVLTSMYGVPLYSQWRFGKGSVGSFMCDLNGTWSNELLNDENGQKLITNIAKNLMPISNIRPLPMNVTLSEDNYTNRLSITTELEKGESIKADIQKVGGDETLSLNEKVSDELTPEELAQEKCYVTSNLSADSAYSKATFVIKDSGTYKITILKVDEAGNELSRVEFYKTFSYSAEYDEFLYSGVNLKENLKQLAKRGGGSVVEDNSNPQEILNGFLTKLPREFDPRYLFAILSILMFLLDIIVRKFKFKWIHEIIREKKLAANEQEMSN